MTMLRQRVITAAVAGIVAVAAVMMLPSKTLAAVLLAIVLVGAWEWARLAGLKSIPARVGYTLLVAVLAGFGWWMRQRGLQLPFVALGVVWWVFALVALASYQPGGNASRIGMIVAGLPVLAPSWLALVDLHAIRPSLLLYLFVLIWLADSAAYFTGKRFGKTRLAPALSPGKSREGVLGALVATLLLGLAGAQWFEAGLVAGAYFVLLSLLTALVSVEGDLFESLLKRRAGVKDSGRILPGHGGVLDRIDSLTAAAPVFWLGLYWIRVPSAA